MAEAPKYEKPRLSYQNSDSTSTHARGDDVTEVVEEKTPFEVSRGSVPSSSPVRKVELLMLTISCCRNTSDSSL